MSPNPLLKSLRDQVIANPNDVGVRRVYADALLGAGDPRGLFIQVQCDLAELPADSPLREKLLQTERELLEKHFEAFAKPLRIRHKNEIRFVRGFIEEWTCHPSDFIALGNKLTSRTPLRKLTLFSVRDSHLQHLLKIAGLSSVSDLSLHELHTWPFAALANGRFSHLERLCLQGEPANRSSAFDTLCQSEWFTELQAFELLLPVGEEVISILAHSVVSQSLVQIRLRCDSARAIEELLRNCPRLTSCTVEMTRAIDAESALRALTMPPSAIETLTIRFAKLTEPLVGHLIHASSLKAVSLWNCEISEVLSERLRVRFGNQLVGSTPIPSSMLSRFSSWLRGQ